jgi:hypothetical protein
MKFNKSYLVMAMAAMAGLFTSCSEDGSWDAYDMTSEKTYSFEQKTMNYEISASDSLSQITVNVFRSNAEGNDTLPLNVVLNNDIMTCDTFVVFNNGEANAKFLIGVDQARIENGKKYTANISFLTDSIVSLTGNASTSISLQMSYTWEPIGTAIYTDDAITPFFKVESLTWEVEAEKVVGLDIIRLKNVYGAGYAYNEPGDWDDSKDYYIVFNCVDPEGVYIDGWCDTGLDWGYEMFSITSYGWYMMNQGYPFEQVKAAGYMGTIDENLVITFPVKGLVASMPGLGTTYGNNNGAFKLDLSTTTLAE